MGLSDIEQLLDFVNKKHAIHHENTKDSEKAIQNNLQLSFSSHEAGAEPG
jgi:hypothetical protein